MTNYLSRLDRIETAISPQDQLIVLLVKDGQTREAALAAYADRRGLTTGEVRCPVVYFTEDDAAVL